VLCGCVLLSKLERQSMWKSKGNSHVVRNFVWDCFPTSSYCGVVTPVPKGMLGGSGGTSLTILALEERRKVEDGVLRFNMQKVRAVVAA